jgi:phosphatidylethanolamine/phosphatidyl-N-methylethanolamine N-methyltransferase
MTDADHEQRKNESMNFRQFLKLFVLYPSQTGAVAASSEKLSELITDTAELSKELVVIEFGSGTGVFTEKILKKIHKDATFFAMEVNADFVKATKSRCPGVEVYHDCATNTRKYLEAHGHQFCDCIISGLPWASFDIQLQDNLLGTILDVLKPGGKFLTFAYLQGLLLPSGSMFKKKLYTKFRKVKKTRTVWLNIPPAFVYCAEK